MIPTLQAEDQKFTYDRALTAVAFWLVRVKHVNHEGLFKLGASTFEGWHSLRYSICL